MSTIVGGDASSESDDLAALYDFDDDTESESFGQNSRIVLLNGAFKGDVDARGGDDLIFLVGSSDANDAARSGVWRRDDGSLAHSNDEGTLRRGGDVRGGSGSDLIVLNGMLVQRILADGSDVSGLVSSSSDYGDVDGSTDRVVLLSGSVGLVRLGSGVSADGLSSEHYGDEAYLVGLNSGGSFDGETLRTLCSLGDVCESNVRSPLLKVVYSDGTEVYTTDRSEALRADAAGGRWSYVDADGAETTNLSSALYAERRGRIEQPVRSRSSSGLAYVSALSDDEITFDIRRMLSVTRRVFRFVLSCFMCATRTATGFRTVRV